MQQSQVAREQAGKDGALLAQSVQGAAAIRKQEESKEEVTKTEDPKDGAPAIRDRSGAAAGGGGAGGQRAEDEEEGSETDTAKEEVVRDPNLGNRVDLTG
ncbi:MAG TPA: hypothetical protein VMC79_03060 [Rectinemataceae bacterium]|nr:hypothetical protein [Rectinemataceae bacterium]